MHGPLLESRVAAAVALQRVGDPAAVPAMIREWQQKPEGKEEKERVWEQVVEYLSGCDSPEAISALATDLGSRPQNVKYQVIVAIGDTNRWSWHHKRQPASPATLEAIERALVSSLEDTTECFNTSFSRNEKGLSDPRICDLAAWFLSDRWPARYAFNVSGSLAARNHQRIECLNSWRSAHNLPPVPLPSLKPPLPRAQLGREEATKVTAIEWSEDSTEPRPAFAAQIAKLKDKRLLPNDFIGLLTSYAAHPEPNAMGLDLKAFKDADLTGVRLVARLIPGKPPTPNGSIGWDISQYVHLAGKALEGSSGGGILGSYTKAQDWERLETGIKQALSNSAETPFEVGARIAASGGFRITGPPR